MSWSEGARRASLLGGAGFFGGEVGGDPLGVEGGGGIDSEVAVNYGAVGVGGGPGVDEFGGEFAADGGCEGA